jgi:hypothetical protein
MNLTLAGTELDCFHVCAFFNSRDEEYDILLPFFREALDQGEQNLHIVDPAMEQDHLRRLQDAGIDTGACCVSGQLQVLPWNRAYVDDHGTFDKANMLATIEALTGEGRDTDFKRLRIMGNMGWAFRKLDGTDQLIEYEAEVNEVVARNRQPAVCVYDVANLTGAMMMDLLRTHPRVLIGGVLQENPFYTPPAEMLEELKAREARAA